MVSTTKMSLEMQEYRDSGGHKKLLTQAGYKGIDGGGGIPSWKQKRLNLKSLPILQL